MLRLAHGVSACSCFVPFVPGPVCGWDAEARAAAVSHMLHGPLPAAWRGSRRDVEVELEAAHGRPSGAEVRGATPASQNMPSRFRPVQQNAPRDKTRTSLYFFFNSSRLEHIEYRP